MKRKPKSEMNHALPLPEFKSNKPIVKCFNCGNKYLKSGMCKNQYNGKLVFKRAVLSDLTEIAKV